MIDVLSPIRHRLRYDARRYWNHRFRYYGSLRAAGDRRLSLTENECEYHEDWRTLARHLPPARMGNHAPARTVLEIGPGTGYYTRLLSFAYPELTGLEVSDVAARRLQEQGYNIIRGDICQFMPQRQWDLVLMIEVVQHIVTRRAFRQAMRSLRAIVGKQLIMGALCDKRARRTALHVHQWTAGDVMTETGFKGERLCDFRTGGLWRFTMGKQ